MTFLQELFMEMVANPLPTLILLICGAVLLLALGANLGMSMADNKRARQKAEDDHLRKLVRKELRRARE